MSSVTVSRAAALCSKTELKCISAYFPPGKPGNVCDNVSSLTVRVMIAPNGSREGAILFCQSPAVTLDLNTTPARSQLLAYSPASTKRIHCIAAASGPPGGSASALEQRPTTNATAKIELIPQLLIMARLPAVSAFPT